MIKAIPPGSFDFGDRVASMLKIAHDGLRGFDLKEFVKRAGHEMADLAKGLMPKPGEVLVHLLAMGAVEGSGANRNADGWKAATLREDHITFQKLAHFYRDHRNSDPAKSYGTVPLSHYNEEMRRVELIAALNGTKEAAERNGGLVADKELELLERGDDIPVSMSTNCGYDKCSSCGNKARTRREYCDGAKCPHGGLKKNAGKVFEDGHRLYADTYKNKFKDISNVGRPADYTAYTFGKVAAANGPFVSGAELAEMLNLSVPLDDVVEGTNYPGGNAELLRRIKVARQLVERVENFSASEGARPLAHRERIIGLEKIARHEVPVALKAFAQDQIALTLPEWLQVCTGLHYEKCAATAAAVQPYLIGELRILADDAQLPDLLALSRFPDDEPAYMHKKTAMLQREKAGLDCESFRRRVWLTQLRDPIGPGWTIDKTASAPEGAAREIARNYLAYQIEVATAVSTRVDAQDTHQNLVMQLCTPC